MSLNVCTFSGHLGRDAESKYLPSGTGVMEFSMAVNSGFGENKTSWWLKCAMFGERGINLTKYMTKGTQVAVSGEFVPRPYKTVPVVRRSVSNCASTRLSCLAASALTRRPQAAPRQSHPAVHRIRSRLSMKTTIRSRSRR